MAISHSILIDYCLVLLLAYTISIVLYSLYFHPLSKIPGPFLARISTLWSRVGNFQGRKSERIHHAHSKYGPVVRVGPNELSFSDPSAVREIYTSKVFVKEETFYRAKKVFQHNHLFSFRDPEAHNQRRKLLSRGFAQASLLEFEPHIASKVKVLLDQFARFTAGGTPINVYPWAHMLTFDTVYHLMFGEDPGTLKTGQQHEAMKGIRSWRPLYIYKEFVPPLEEWGVYAPGTVGQNFRNVQAWKVFAVNVVRTCRQKGTKTPFLSRVLDGEDAYLGRPLTDSELAEECMGGMFGGSGTTANTFVYILWASLHRPEVVKKLKAELKGAFPDPKVVPDSMTCSKLSYLQAVINETLRRYPTIIATLPRTSKEDVVVCGIPIPKGTIVGTQNYTIHRNVTAFPDPESWNPDRWLDEEGQEARNEAFTPFSVGSRKCVAPNLAEMELSILTAAFFRRFDGKIDNSMTEEEMRMYDTFNAGATGAKLLVHLTESEK